MKQKPDWLEGAVIYQIYPRSFYDAKGTGVGNLAGIIEKLDYLAGTPQSLGVDGIWLSPVFTSPMADFGYDIVDYTAIDPLFGSMDDFNRLIHEAHDRKLKVLLDLVPNHTSDQHQWFQASKSSRDNPKRNWYVWRDGKPNSEPPNNWLAVFGGSAWEFSETTGQYYVHSFLRQQPDLNWDNPEVREAMMEIMRFWLKLGVDGFRVDAIDFISKDPEYRDDPFRPSESPLDPLNYGSFDHTMSQHGPRLHDRLREMGQVVREFDNRFMIIEGHPADENKADGYLWYYLTADPDLYAPFNFEPIFLPWRVTAFKQFVDTYQKGMKPGFTPIYTSGNHDETRVGTRLGVAAARVSALMVLTLPGVAFLYYGEELGMTNVPIAPDQVRDPYIIHGHNRDPERTPMQWSGDRYAGFSASEPWLPVADNYVSVNVASEQSDQHSMLQFYKQLLVIRGSHEALKSGQYIPVECDQSVFCYRRETDQECCFIGLNFTDNEQRVTIAATGQILLSTHSDRTVETVDNTLTLLPNEGIIILLKN